MASSMAALSTGTRRCFGAGFRRWGALARAGARGATAGATAEPRDGGIPGPLKAHADRLSTAASRYESSALPRQIAGYMALLIEDVPAVWRVPGPHSSVRKSCATRNRTLTIGHSAAPSPQVAFWSEEADRAWTAALIGTRRVRYKPGTMWV